MMRFLLRCLTAGVLISLLMPPPIPTNAQPTKIYFQVFRALLVDWNAKKLVFEKSSLVQEFNRNVRPEISARVKAQPLRFETKSWAEERFAEWDALPKKVTPTLPLSKESEDLLLILYSNNASEFAERVKPDEQEIRRRLQLPMVLTIATAEIVAKKRGASVISTTDLTIAIRNWFTGIWPICSLTSRLVPLATTR